MKFIEYLSQNVHYTDKGEGPVLVLLHGFTESLEIWKSFSDTLSESFRVVCIDLPGHGRTANFAANHTMELMASVVHSVLVHCNIKECIMVGHSMGGYVSLAFANLFPAMLKGLILFHSQADCDDQDAKRNRDRAINLIKMNRHGFLNQFIPDLFADCNREKLQYEINVLKNQAGSISAKALIAALEGMKSRPDLRELLSGIEIPVMFIAGKLDTRISFSKVLEQLALPKHAEALLLDGVGHMGYLEAPEITMEAVRSFAMRAAITGYNNKGEPIQ